MSDQDPTRMIHINSSSELDQPAPSIQSDSPGWLLPALAILGVIIVIFTAIVVMLAVKYTHGRPEPVTSSLPGVEGTADYRVIQTLMDHAWKESGATPDAWCAQWATKPEAITDGFIDLPAVASFDHQTAAIAVMDWFDTLCA